ncbi:hypothetical protein [Brevundimonas sp.]|uniref:hypothetical protein n=1 Tax=Brevundimonas sp. TaxID=1871086 RepID=UPI003A100552
MRGGEYLRIIYGPEYDAPENLVRLRERGLGGKRNLALREFALGHEVLKRFVAREPLRRVPNACSPSWRWKASRSIPAFKSGMVRRTSAVGARPPSPGPLRLRNAHKVGCRKADHPDVR